MNKLTDQSNESMLVVFQTVHISPQVLKNDLYTGNPIIILNPFTSGNQDTSERKLYGS